MNKNKLPKPKKICITAMILMSIILIAWMAIINLGEYIDFLREISTLVNVFTIISEIILFIILIIGAGLYMSNGYQFTARVSLKDASEEFNDIYKKIYSKYNRELKKVKGNIGKLQAFLWVLIVFGCFYEMILSFLLNASQSFIQEYYSILLIAFFLGVPYLIVNSQKNKEYDYTQYFKENCMKDFLSMMNIKYSHVPSMDLNDEMLEIFNKTETDACNAENADINDYIEKNINGINIKLVDVTFSGMGMVFFEGLFGYTKLNKNVNYKFRIRSINMPEKCDLKKIEQINPEFNKMFSVYSENGKLPTGIGIEYLIEICNQIYNKYGIDFEINVKGDLIAIKYNTGKIFEPTIVGKGLNKEVMHAYYCIAELSTQLLYKITDYLK